MLSFKKYCQLTEKIIMKGRLVRHNLQYVYGSSKSYPSTLLGRDNDGFYHILTLKTHKIIVPYDHVAETELIHDAKHSFTYWKNLAQREKILKKSYDDLTPQMFVEILTKEGVHRNAINKMFPELSTLKLDKTLKAGDFNIIYMDEKSGEQIADIFKQACAAASLIANLSSALVRSLYSSEFMG